MKQLWLIALLLAVPAQAGDYSVGVFEEQRPWPLLGTQWRVRIMHEGVEVSERIFMFRVRAARAIHSPEVAVAATVDGLWRWPIGGSGTTQVPGTDNLDYRMLELCGVLGVPFAATGRNTQSGDQPWRMQVINVNSGLWRYDGWTCDPYQLEIVPGTVSWHDHELFYEEYSWTPM